jgi:beta-galactosidase/beta-glucuronidase
MTTILIGILLLSAGNPTEPRTIDAVLKELGPVPRAEHPRPDRLRPDWCNLNGIWEFAMDGKNVGETEHWNDGRKLSGRIVVPFCRESALGGVCNQSLDAFCWYAKSFDCPKNLQGGRVLLHFGAVDYQAKVWLNGRPLGEHEGGYDSFEFDVTKDLLPSGNRLVLRVKDDHNESKPKGKQSPTPGGCYYMRTTGIWQTVWLEGVGSTFVRNWTVHADPASGQLRLDMQMDGPASDLRTSVRVSREGKQVAEGAAACKDGQSHLTLTVANPMAWTPDNPALYDLAISLETPEGRAIDRVESYVGFRTIEIRGNQFYLNGKPFFLISALDQGYYPDGLYTAPSDTALRADVEWAKRFGLNSVRKHQISADPRYLYWCDRLGLTVWGEMADGGANLAEVPRFLKQWTSCIRRDLNHPCIITWVPTNERKPNEPGEGDENMVNRTSGQFYDATRQLDPTRPIVDNSGYCHAKTDIVDFHICQSSGKAWQAWWSKWRQSVAKSGNMSIYEHAMAFNKGFRYSGQPVVISEEGHLWMRDCRPLNPAWSMPDWKQVFATTPDEFIAIYRDQKLALMAEPDCAGFSDVQLYDVESEMNGYLTYDRKPKIPPEKIAAIHAEGLRLREKK